MTPAVNLDWNAERHLQVPGNLENDPLRTEAETEPREPRDLSLHRVAQDQIYYSKNNVNY